MRGGTFLKVWVDFRIVGWGASIRLAQQSLCTSEAKTGDTVQADHLLIEVLAQISLHKTEAESYSSNMDIQQTNQLHHRT